MWRGSWAAGATLSACVELEVWPAPGRCCLDGPWAGAVLGWPRSWCTRQSPESYPGPERNRYKCKTLSARITGEVQGQVAQGLRRAALLDGVRRHRAHAATATHGARAPTGPQSEGVILVPAGWRSRTKTPKRIAPGFVGAEPAGTGSPAATSTRGHVTPRPRQPAALPGCADGSGQGQAEEGVP